MTGEKQRTHTVRKKKKDERREGIRWRKKIKREEMGRMETIGNEKETEERRFRTRRDCDDRERKGYV
jgi:hypothetical protein